MLIPSLVVPVVPSWFNSSPHFLDAPGVLGGLVFELCSFPASSPHLLAARQQFRCDRADFVLDRVNCPMGCDDVDFSFRGGRLGKETGPQAFSIGRSPVLDAIELPPHPAQGDGWIEIKQEGAIRRDAVDGDGSYLPYDFHRQAAAVTLVDDIG